MSDHIDDSTTDEEIQTTVMRDNLRMGKATLDDRAQRCSRCADLENDRDGWKRQYEMYRSAWLREIGGVIVRKSHEIDGFVLRTQQIYQQAGKWIAYENGLLGRDPFWMVPDSEAKK